MNSGDICTVEKCDRPIRYRKHRLCNAHDQRRRNGIPMEAPIRRYAPGEFGKWCTNGGGYVQRERIIDGVREYEFQHREVMKTRLGRDLFPGEEVHHLNGVKTDNRIENLELWSTSQPRGQRLEDKVAWALSIIEQYEPWRLK